MTLLPLIPSQALEAVLSSHIVRESATSLSATLPLQFVRLSVSCVPAFLLLSVAGVTSFCRGVTSLVLGISAIPQGCTLFWLYRRMGSDCLTTEGTYLLSPWLLFWAYCAFTVVRICLRIVLTLSSSHTAEHFFDSETRLSNGERGVSPLLARHLLICLLSAFAGALTCFAYIFVINTF